MLGLTFLEETTPMHKESGRLQLEKGGGHREGGSDKFMHFHRMRKFICLRSQSHININMAAAAEAEPVNLHG